MYRRDFVRQTVWGTAGLGLLGPAKPTARPNILLCVADDISFPHAGAYGCRWTKTPGFDRVAEQGLLFNRAYTPNAKCAPSRSCLLTGRNSWQLEEAANHWCFFPEKFRTYPEALADAGYFVGYTGKGWGPGVQNGHSGRRRELTGRPFSERRTPAPTPHIADIDYAGNFRDFLEERPKNAPFCFWYGALEPHRPTEFRAGVEKGGKKLSQIDRIPSFWPDNDTVRHDLLDYAYEIEHFDRHLERMLEILESSGQLDNTLVVVTADNGMAFPRVKGQAYESSNHLPMAIMWKDGIRRPGRSVDVFASFIDLAPTFLDIAGIKTKASGMQPIEGRSLTDVFSASGIVAGTRDFMLVGKERHDVGRPQDVGYPIRGIMRDGYLYLVNFEPDRWPAGNPETGYLNCDGSPTKTECLQARKKGEEKYWNLCFGKRPSEELYKVSEDPDCVRNLAGGPQHEHARAALRKELFRRLKQQNDPRMKGQGDVFDRYPYAHPETRGFYERFMAGEKIKADWVNETDFEPTGK